MGVDAGEEGRVLPREGVLSLEEVVVVEACFFIWCVCE